MPTAGYRQATKCSNVVVIEPSSGIFGSMGKLQTLLEYEITISLMLISSSEMSWWISVETLD